MRGFRAAAAFLMLAGVVGVPAAVTITPVQINDLSNFATWARTATPATIAGVKGASSGLYNWAMRASVPTGHTLTLCSIAEQHPVPHGPMTDTGAGCFGPSAATRNATTQAACRRLGIATIGPQLPGFAHAWHGGSGTDPTTVDVWTLGHSRVHFRCLRTGTFGYGLTPEFDVVLEITVGSQPFLPY